MDWPVRKVRQPRFLELGLFPPRVENQISLEAFIEGEGLMIGDRVTARRRILPAVEGDVVGFHAPFEPVRKTSALFETTGVLVRVAGKDRYFRPERLRLARRQSEYKGYWKAWCENEAAYIRAVVDSDPLHPRYDEEASSPVELAFVDLSASFRSGREVAYAGLDDGLAQSLFRRAVVQADHLLDKMRKEPLPAGTAEAGRAVRRESELKIQRTRSYAAVLLGEPFDADSLADSARHWAEGCAAVPSGSWDDLDKLKLLRAIKWSMIAGDFDSARELATSKRSFRWHQDHKQLLSKMLRKTVPPHKDSELVGRCRAFFDLIRHPRVELNRFTFDKHMTAFDWGVLMVKLIDRPGEAIDWRAVVEGVSR